MPIALYLVPYTRELPYSGPWLANRAPDLLFRGFAQAEILSAVETLGGKLIVKVDQDVLTLTLLDATYYRFPTDRLGTRLDTVSATQRVQLREQIEALGFSTREVDTAFPNGFADVELSAVLKFMASRVHLPRYDAGKDEIVLDDLIDPPKDDSPLVDRIEKVLAVR